jgi:hypothetical protein
MHIQNMLNRESVTVFANGRYDNPRTFVDTLHTVAWRCVPSVSAYSHALSLRQHDFIKKVLITPPEAGPDGTRGVGPTRPEHPFTPIRSWMVRIDVSDEKLAQILTLFDAMSFDPETYISARYGQEGTDYSWEGAPYASAVNEVYRSAPAIKITTDVILNDVVKPLYAFGSGVLLEYAENNGEWQPVPNYNQAVWGDRANEKYLIDGRIGEDIDNTVSRYLSDVLLDRKNLEDDWNAYIEKLNELGVEAYVEYYNGE